MSESASDAQARVIAPLLKEIAEPDPSATDLDAPASPMLLHAVDFLLALKDGERGAYYRANKDYAWQRLRDAADVARGQAGP